MVPHHICTLGFPLERDILIYSSFIKRLSLAIETGSMCSKISARVPVTAQALRGGREVMVPGAEGRLAESIFWLQPWG